MRNIERKFGFRMLQRMLTLYNNIVKEGFTIEDFVEYVELRKKENEEYNIDKKGALRSCPDCKHPLNLIPVNTGPGDQTGDDSKAVWLCSTCYWEEYIPETVEETMVKIAERIELGG